MNIIDKMSAKTSLRQPPVKKPRYSVPALDKALDLLDLLANSEDGYTLRELTLRLHRTAGEIYRVLMCLEQRGFIQRALDSDRFSLTLKLFELSHRHLPTARLIKQALPLMERLAMSTDQSCHLGTLYEDKVLVIASVQSPKPMFYAVKVGSLFPISETSSGVVIRAYDPPEKREDLITGLSTAEARTIERRIRLIQQTGHECLSSTMIAGITNVTCPIFDHSGCAIAALITPYLEQRGLRVSLEEAVGLTVETGRQISAALGYSTMPESDVTIAEPTPPLPLASNRAGRRKKPASPPH